MANFSYFVIVDELEDEVGFHSKESAQRWVRMNRFKEYEITDANGRRIEAATDMPNDDYNLIRS